MDQPMKRNAIGTALNEICPNVVKFAKLANFLKTFMVMAMYALLHFVYCFYPFLSNNVILENPETVFCLILKRMRLPQLNHLSARA